MTFSHCIRTIFFTCLVAATVTQGALAATAITYDQSTGNLRIVYDGVISNQQDDQLFGVQFASSAKLLKQPPSWPTEWQSLPAVLDLDDLPELLTVLFIPVGVTEIPGGVVAGTPISDLTAQIFNQSPWVQEYVPITAIPEPQSIALAASGLFVLAGRRRRRQPR